MLDFLFLFWNWLLSLDKLFHGISVLDITFSLWAAADFKLNSAPNSNIWIRTVAFFIYGFGGGTLSAFLIGIPPGWISSDHVVLFHLLMVIMAFTPVIGDFYVEFVNLSIIKHLLAFFFDVGWATGVTSWGIDIALDNSLHSRKFSALSSFHNHSLNESIATTNESEEYEYRFSFFGLLFVGLVAGLGGGILRTGLNLNQRIWKISVPQAYTLPMPYAVKIVFSMSLFYLLSTNPTNINFLGLNDYIPRLTRSSAKGFCIIMCVATNSFWNLITKIIFMNHPLQLAHLRTSNQVSKPNLRSALLNHSNNQGPNTNPGPRPTMIMAETETRTGTGFSSNHMERERERERERDQSPTAKANDLSVIQQSKQVLLLQNQNNRTFRNLTQNDLNVNKANNLRKTNQIESSIIDNGTIKSNENTKRRKKINS